MNHQSRTPSLFVNAAQGTHNQQNPENVLIREEAKFPVTKNVNSISLARGEEERSDKIDVATGNEIEKPTRTEMGMQVKEAEKKNEAGKEEMTEQSLEKKITRKEDIRVNFEIPCNIGGLKHMNTLVDQESNVNIMPLSTYMKLTDERHAETDIRLSLASHSYIYPLGIAEDILVEVSEHVYPVDFVFLDIKEDEKRPFILGTPFLTTAKAVIKFDKGSITLRSGKTLEFDPLPSLWYLAFEGNTRDLGSFGEETDKTTNQHQDSSRFKVSEPDENKNNQAVDNNVGDQEDPNVNDEQEVKNVDDQEIENVKDEKGKNVKDEQVSEQTINETACTITSLQSEMEKLLMELQLNNSFREALETRSKGLEKKRLDLNPMLHDLQKVAAAQKKKKMEAEIQRRIWNPEIKIAFQDNTLRARRFRRSEECYALSLGMFYYLFRNVFVSY
ncbi:hypothetical protein Tco_0947499 [Tanacetum coccineum]